MRTETGMHGTFGVLFAGGGAWQVAEPPWRDNRRNVSCIPAGTYRAVWHRSPRFGPVYWVRDVPGRSGILIHPGNLAGDRERGLLSHTYGCLLPGRYRGALRGQQAVLASRPATRALFEALGPAEEITLTILEAWR